MKKVCPQCGSEFECKHNTECFCMQYTLSKETLAILKEKYSNCLCEDCLKKYASASGKNNHR